MFVFAILSLLAAQALALDGGSALSPPALSIGASSTNTATKTWEYAVSFNDRILLYDASWQEVGRTALEFQQITSLVYDEIGDQIYFIDMKTRTNGSIYSLTRDPLHPHTYITMGVVVEKKVHDEEEIRGLAFDPVERCLYWIDEKLRIIYKLDVRQKNAQPVVWWQFEQEVPQALSVDICRRFLYWTTDNDNVTTIERASLVSGANHTVLVSERMQRPIALEIDQFSNRMFWIDEHMGTQVSIESSDLRGDSRELIYDGAGRKFRSLIVDEEHVFVVDSANECVFRLNKTANSSVELLQHFDKSPRGIIKRTRFIDTHEQHAICQSAVYYVKGHYDEKVEKTKAAETAASGKSEGALEVANHSQSAVCLNGRVDGQGHCKCSDGWTGKHCETKVCQNFCFHGKCTVSKAGLPLCHCEAGFVGERCETSLCNGYCLNGGQCELEDGDSPACKCLSAFSGRHCEMINSRPVICRAYCEVGMMMPNIDWSIEDECSCGNTTAAEPLCSVRAGGGGPLGQHFIYVIVAGVLVTILLMVVMVLGAIRRWYKPARPKIKKTYVVRKNVTPMTYRPTAASERCEITIENCCNMEYCDTPCFDPKILVKDGSEKETISSKEDKRDLLSNIVLDNNSDLF